MARKLIFNKDFPYTPSKVPGVTFIKKAGKDPQTVNEECAAFALKGGYAVEVAPKKKSGRKKPAAGGTPKPSPLGESPADE